MEHFVIPCLVFTKSSLVLFLLTKFLAPSEYLDGYLPLQLPHGLPPTSLTLETEVEKRFLQDPSWLPIHDKDLAFQRFLKYRFLQKMMIVIQFTKIIWGRWIICFYLYQSDWKRNQCGLPAQLQSVSATFWADCGQRSDHGNAAGLHWGSSHGHCCYYPTRPKQTY